MLYEVITIENLRAVVSTHKMQVDALEINVVQQAAKFFLAGKQGASFFQWHREAQGGNPPFEHKQRFLVRRCNIVQFNVLANFPVVVVFFVSAGKGIVV